MGEQVAVINADTERIGSTIGEAANGDVLRIYSVAAKYLLQCSINQDISVPYRPEITSHVF